jgi:sugar O-acyltransferase (sialic acid O-acetyltransferase NeuD family)
MLIAGAGGFSRQLMPIIRSLGFETDLVLFDENQLLKNLYEFPVIHSLEEVQAYFKNVDSRFTLGIGRPVTRGKFTSMLIDLGGTPQTIISPKSLVTNKENISKGTAILANAIIEEDAILSDGVLVNLNALVCHEAQIGKFVEISPGAILLGACKIGDYTSIGAGAIVNPLVKIGRNAVIGAGAVVTKDIPDYSTAVGIPAKTIKSHNTAF